MQFIFHKDAKNPTLTISGELYTHIFRARRTKRQESLILRNLCDLNAYTYKISNLSKKEATLTLQSTEFTPLKNPPTAHIIWALIEPKVIEKTLPFLNELNAKKLTFFYASFSQKNFKLDFERLARILENSCMQCGRITKMELEILPNLESVLQNYPKLAVMDFGAESLKESLEIPLLIGTEGGFSEKEREILKNQVKFSAPNCNILRSESAVIYALSKIV